MTLQRSRIPFNTYTSMGGYQQLQSLAVIVLLYVHRLLPHIPDICLTQRPCVFSNQSLLSKPLRFLVLGQRGIWLGTLMMLNLLVGRVAQYNWRVWVQCREQRLSPLSPLLSNDTSHLIIEQVLSYCLVAIPQLFINRNRVSY